MFPGPPPRGTQLAPFGSSVGRGWGWAAIGTVAAPPASARTGTHCGDTDVRLAAMLAHVAQGPAPPARPGLRCRQPFPFSAAALLGGDGQPLSSRGHWCGPGPSCLACGPAVERSHGRWVVAARCVCASRVQSALPCEGLSWTPRGRALEAPVALCQV